MRGLRLALQFLTVVPVRVAGEVRPEDLRAALAWFPAVGLLVGGFLGLMQRHVLPWDRLGALALVALGLLLTGCLHLDGLADLADALCARKDREGRLAVMKDPRVGAAGAAAVALALLARWELLSQLEGRRLLPALLLAPLLGRAAMVLLLRILPPARPGGLGALWSPAPGGAVAAALLAFALPAAFLQGGAGAALAAAGVLASVAWAARRAFGGQTGDVCGAAGELVELAALAGMLKCG